MPRLPRNGCAFEATFLVVVVVVVGFVLIIVVRDLPTSDRRRRQWGVFFLFARTHAPFHTLQRSVRL